MADIYKVCTRDQWNSFQKTGIFVGSELDQKSGYLHLSEKHQLQRILEKYFTDEYIGSVENSF